MFGSRGFRSSNSFSFLMQGFKASQEMKLFAVSWTCWIIDWSPLLCPLGTTMVWWCQSHFHVQHFQTEFWRACIRGTLIWPLQLGKKLAICLELSILQNNKLLTEIPSHIWWDCYSKFRVLFHNRGDGQHLKSCVCCSNFSGGVHREHQRCIARPPKRLPSSSGWYLVVGPQS